MTQVELAVEFAKLDPEARLPTQGLQRLPVGTSMH